MNIGLELAANNRRSFALPALEIKFACFFGGRNWLSWRIHTRIGLAVTFVLILHDLIAVALLGALTHQCVALLRCRAVRSESFIDRYSSVSSPSFTRAIVVLYMAAVLLGAILYPAYRSDVRIEFEQMSMGWAVGAFELKEHFAGLGLGLLPVYARAWRGTQPDGGALDRRALTLIVAAIVWWDFLVGHVLNNIRGLG